MDDGTTLKIEVSTGASSPSSAPASSSDPLGGKTFGEHRKDQIRATGDFNRRMQEERMELEREKARRKNEQWLERFEERSAKRREREEAKREREQEKAERKQEKERRKLEVADNRQERDETWYERDLQRQEKEKQRDKERAERMQNRDEDWYERDQQKQAAERKREEQRKWWENPNNVAQNQLKMGERAASIRGSASAQRMGFSANSAITRFASGLSATAFKFQPLIAVAGALYGAWQAAKKNLLDESRKVARYSPALQMQNMVNNMRTLQTDIEIANKYGEQMARMSDRENRQQNATRLIGAQVSSWLAGIMEPFDELKTQVLEYFAGIQNVSADSTKYLKEISGYSKEQLDAMGIKASQQNAIATGMKNAEKVLQMLSMDGAVTFKESDEMTRRAGEFNILDNGAFPGEAPDANNPAQSITLG